MTETEEVTWGLPSRSRCGREMDCSGRRNWSWNCWGEGPFGISGGQLELCLMMAGVKWLRGTRRVRFIHHKWTSICTHTQPTHLLNRTGKHKPNSWQTITQSQTRTLNHTNWLNLNQSVLGSHALSAVQTDALSWLQTPRYSNILPQA